MTCLRILLVDDNELLLRSLARVLRRGGHEVFACGSPEAACVELECGVPYDLALTDFDLGHTTCDALVAQIRERSPTTRVILLTGAPRTLLPKGVPVISKPISATDLLRTILPDAG